MKLGPPPIDQAMFVEGTSRLSPEWARWFMDLYRAVKSLL